MKKIFTFCVSLLAALSVFAYDFQSGDLFYNITSSSAPYTVEVTRQSQFYYGNYSGVDTIVIPETVTYDSIIYSVTSIGAGAFDGCSSLTSITIPNGVTSIGERAFDGCDKLTSITIPNSVTSIGDWAFGSCRSLTSITLPNSVTSIGSHAFSNCFPLTSITIPNSVTSIGERAFDGCDKLTSMVVESGNIIYDSRENCDAIIETATNTLIAGCQNTIIPNSVTSIGDYAFDNCSSLTSIIIPNNVTSIGERAFADCSSLTSVTIGNSVTSIGEHAFSGCSSLTSMIVENGNTIYDSRENCNAIIETATNTLVAGCKNTIIPNSVTSIGDWAFSYCRSLISITIPNSVTSIGSHAFGSCYSLTSITLPNSVTSIGGGAFSFCSSLTSVTIGNSVTSIGGEAFPYCRSLTSITIPESVTSIGDRAFSGCDSLISIVVEDGNATYDSRTNCNAIIETATNTLIAGCQNTIIPNSVTSIGSHAFSDCSSLTSITIPNSVTSIGSHAFGSCSSLTSITIPNSVTSIGKYAFNECSSLNTIYVESATPSVLGEFALARPICVIPCGSLAAYKSSAWSEQVGSFKEDCVEGYQITTYTSTDGNIVTPNKTDVFGTNIISNTYVNGVGRFYFDGIVTSIGDSAFYNCETLSSITLPETVTLLGYGSFDDCTSLTKIRVKATTPPKMLGGYTFHNAPLDTCLIPCGTLDAYQSSDWASQVGEFVEVCPAVVKAKVPASWEDDVITVWVWTDGEGTEYPTTKEGDWYVYTHSDAEEFNIIFKSGTGWKGNTYQTVDINGITENTCLEIQPTTGKATYTIVDCPSIIYELNGGVTNDYGWQSKGAVALELQNDYNAAYGTSKEWAKSENGYIYYKLGEEWVREDLVPAGTDCKTAGFIAYVTYNNSDNFKNLFAANPDKYGWLNDIIIATRTAAGLSVDEASMAEIIYRYELSAFFLCSPERTSWPGTSSYEVAGTFESFKTIWKQAFANPTNPAEEFVLNAPYKEGYTFAGWYTTPDFSGEKVTTINAETNGTLYAKWINNDWIITYTSTDGNIITPRDTTGFGANIVSNTYDDGQGIIVFDGPVTSIDGSGFWSCTNLTSITIPNSVTSIGDSPFYWCSSLTSVTIPNSVTSIGRHAFGGCSSLNSVVVESGNIYYDSRENCNAIIETVTNTLIVGCQSTSIPNSVTSIGKHAFVACRSLTSITIPNSVTSIGGSAFYGCSSLTSITIPNSVMSIGDVAFGDCDAITSVVVESGNATYDSRENCNAIIETATNTLISGCQNTTIPNSVTSIGESAFYYCRSLTSITIPSSVTSIGEGAFFCCYSLSSLTISNSVTSIGGRAFQYCSSLDTIHVESTTPPALEDSTVFMNTPSPVCVIPCGTLAAYQASDWASQVGRFEEDCVEGQQITYTSTNDSIVTPYDVNAFDANIVSNVYENGVGTITFDAPLTRIGTQAFHDCFTLTSIIVPNSVKIIGNAAFSGTYLESVVIGSGVTSIGEDVFGGCGLLTSIVVDTNNTTFDSREDCNAIIKTSNNILVAGCKTTIIPNTIKGIGNYAFAGSWEMTSIEIPDGVETIGSSAFGGCTVLRSVMLPNTLTTIGNDAFSTCPALTSITIPSSVKKIDDDAFWCDYALDTIYVEATTPPTLGYKPFYNAPVSHCFIPCGTLSAYEASAWASQVGEFVEEGCAPIQMCGDDLYWEYADGVLTITGTGDMYDYAADTDVPWYDVRGNIKTVSLPDAMTKIGQNAFYKCTNMTTINMPTSLTAIGEKAFAQDTKLTGELTLPASLTTIDERAFFNCKAVTAFHIEATTPPTLQDKAFDYVVSPIHVPCGYGHIYGKHAQWGMLNLEMCELLQDNVYYYPIDGHTARAVTYHSNPTDTIVIPSAVVIDGVLRTVTEVADFAFTDCDNLPAIYFNEGLEHIGERAFVRCYGLKGTITLPTTLTTIGERAFSYCDNVEKYLLQAMTPPVLGEDVFTGNNKNALFYISCEAMDDYKVATNWSSLKSRLRDACLNIYHYNTPFPLGTNGVYTTEDTLVASIYYRRQFTPYRWETLYLPFEVDRVTVLEDGEEFDLRPWNIITGGDYYLAKPNGMLNLEILFDFTDELEAHTPYIIQFVYDYYRDKIITFYGKESWNKLSTSFEVLSSSAWMQIAGNTTLQDQLLEKPVYMLRSGLDFILQKTTTTLHPFECYVMPYTVQSGAPARMSVRLRDDVATAVESMKGNESRLAYTINGNTLTVYSQGQAFSIYSLNGALIYSCEAGKEAVDCELNSGCYLLHAGTEAHKIML